ncbi:MAG: malonyl-CoA synthase, partial [Beijerinckiaceae bacterium]|nr:malonyl-CoA synthase [Beijerinckiaceae bacterium]
MMINHLFAEIRARMPDPAKRFIETPAGDVFSYGDVVERSAAYANVLVALGVKPGDRVAAQVEKS